MTDSTKTWPATPDQMDEGPLTLRTLKLRYEQAPEFSQRAYRVIECAMYAEPGFSDFEPHELAETMKTSEQAAGGALTYLQGVGLVVIEKADVNGEPFTFLHPVAWADHGVKLTETEVVG